MEKVNTNNLFDRRLGRPSDEDILISLQEANKNMKLESEVKISNCIFIGENAGIDITEGDGIVIIGDNVRSLDKSQPNVLFLGDKVAIGITIQGIPINLKEIIESFYARK